MWKISRSECVFSNNVRSIFQMPVETRASGVPSGREKGDCVEKEPRAASSLSPFDAAPQLKMPFTVCPNQNLSEYVLFVKMRLRMIPNPLYWIPYNFRLGIHTNMR